ncbi:MAG: chemotaxis protein CheC [Pseudomonadota bacterium]
MSNSTILSELEEDLLSELFNVGVGRAANSLSQMVNQEVLLSVPEVKFVSVHEMFKKIGNKEKICGVGQEIHGTFDAHSLLLFPESSSLEVVRKMLGENLTDEIIAEMQQEAMTEIGNIVLNACIGSISNAMQSPISVDLPIFHLDYAENILNPSSENIDDTVLFLTIDMRLKESEVVGYMVFLLGSMFLHNLAQQLKIMLAKMM